MFKKLLSFLFDEEVIDDEEERLEEEIESITKPVEIINEKKKLTYIDVDETVDDVLFETTKNEDVVEPLPINEVPVAKPSRVQVDKPKTGQPYEFSKVISPIFGYKQQPEVLIQVQPKLNVETEKSVLGTVISPIYGAQKSKTKMPATPSKQPVNTHLTIEDVLGLQQQESLEQVEMVITNQTTSVSSQPDLQQQDDQQQSPLDFSWEVEEIEKTDKINKAEVLLQLFEEEVE